MREFSEEPVLDEAIEEIVKAAQFAPSGHGARDVEFIIVKKQEIKDKLFEILQQDFVKKAPVLLVPVANINVGELPLQDLAVASAFAMVQAAALGLGTVWKHIDEKQAKAAAKVLELPKEYVLINLIAVGYPASELPDHSDADFSRGRIHKDIF